MHWLISTLWPGHWISNNKIKNDTCSSAFLGVYLGVLAIADYKTSNEYYNYAVAWQTGIGCNIAGFISVFSSEISIMSMFLIAFDMCYNIRYKYINHIIRFEKKRNEHIWWQVKTFVNYVALFVLLPEKRKIY